MLPSNFEIPCAERGLSARLTVPGSKSLSNRALVMASLARGPSSLHGVLLADDTWAMIQALRALGITIQVGQTITVWGQGGRFPRRQAHIDCCEAGTVARFLLPLLAFSEGDYVLMGSARLNQRPIAPLIDTVRALGGWAQPLPQGVNQGINQRRITCVTTQAAIAGEARLGLPLQLGRRGRLSEGEGRREEMPALGRQPRTVMLDVSLSSQFLSGLLMALPLRAHTSLVQTRLNASAPYVTMTQRLQAHFGVQTLINSKAVATTWQIPGRQRYQPRAYRVPTDLSSASYFFAAATLLGNEVSVDKLSLNDCLQGDARGLELLARMGARVTVQASSVTVRGPERAVRDSTGFLQGITVDLRHCSDLFMTLAVLAPFGDGPSCFSGLGHARVQESDRLAVVAENLKRLGARLEVGEDSLVIYPSALRGTTLRCANDHRIAMAFAVLGLRVPGVILDAPACVSKTFPNFFDCLRKAFL